MIRIPQPQTTDPTCYDAELTQVAADRIERGLAPPREIYSVQNRRRIDWGRLPLWARPSDPGAIYDTLPAP